MKMIKHNNFYNNVFSHANKAENAFEIGLPEQFQSKRHC